MGVWPLIWQWVLLPSASPPGGVMIFSHQQENLAGSPSQVGPGPLARLTLPAAHQSLRALAVWRVERAGRYKLRLKAADYGHLVLDRHHLVALHGPQPNNQGEGSLELAAGPHFLELELDSYFGPGRLEVWRQGPGEGAWQPLAEAELSPLLEPQAPAWLGLAQAIEKTALLGLAAWVAAFFLLLALPAQVRPLTRAGLAFALACVLAAGVSAWFTTDRHERDLRAATGHDALAAEQMYYHRWVMDETSSAHRDHRHYRILPNYVMEGFMLLTRGSRADPSPPLIFFWGRWMVDFLIFVLAALFYRRLGLPRAAVFLGLIILAWVIYPMRYGCLLSHATFLDAAFYLLAGLALAGGRPFLVIPISLLAILNKETALLIPLLPFLAVWNPRHPWRWPRREMLLSLGCLVLALGAFLGLRAWLGWQPLLKPHDQPGWDFVARNFWQDPSGWRHLFYTMGLMPLLALAGLRAAPSLLRHLFWSVAPLWMVVHTVIAWWSETRVFLPALALAVIPLCLFAAQGRGGRAAHGQDQGEAGQGQEVLAEAGGIGVDQKK